MRFHDSPQDVIDFTAGDVRDTIVLARGRHGICRGRELGGEREETGTGLLEHLFIGDHPLVTAPAA